MVVKFLILGQRMLKNCWPFNGQLIWMISVSHEESLLKAVFEMIADENTVMIKAAHVGQLLLLKKEKVWQRERIIVYHVYLWQSTSL